MLLSLAETELQAESLSVGMEHLVVHTQRRVEFIDVTDAVARAVSRTGLTRGLVHVQSRHTTTGVILNEDEPLLLEDLRRCLEAWAPRQARYRHNDLKARTDLPPGERPNADAHARALLLGSGQTLQVAESRLQLGKWQRLFLVELDGPRQRTLSLLTMGQVGSTPGPMPAAARLHARVRQ
jgi:secondary thiamine-phosphate synthase enzyme